MAAMLVVAVNHVKIRFRSEPLYPSDVAFLRDAHLLVMAVGAGHGTATAFSVPAP